MSQYKGLDDLLAGGGKPRRLMGTAVSTFFSSVRSQLFPAALPAEPLPGPAETLITNERPHFPVEVFPETVGRFVHSIAVAMGCPDDFPGVGALTVAASAIGAARSLRVKEGWFEKPGIYAVIVARPGRIKTPALRAVMNPIYEEQDRLHETHKAACQKYKVDIESYKRECKNKEGDAPPPHAPEEPPPMRHLFAADTTIEELANNLKDNRKGILLFRDELSAWVRSMDMYRGKGTDRQFFLSAWSGEMVKVDRKMHHGQPIIVPHPSICVLGGIQPDLLSELEAEGGREDGFIHRVLFSYPDESPIPGWIEAVISNEESMEWHIVLSRLLNLQLLKVEGASERPRFLDFNPQGRQAFIEWFNRQASGMNAEDFPQELVGPCSKMRAYCARFALVLHMLRVACGETGSDQNEGQVDGDDVARAVKLCNYFTAHYRAVIQCLNQTSEDKQVEEFIGWLTRKCLSQTTVREMCRANVCGIKTASEAEKLLVAAVERGYGRWQDGAEWTPGGRKKARVPPFVFSR